MAESVAPAPVGKEVREPATSKVDAPVGQPTGAPPAPHPIAGNGAAAALPKTPLPALTIAAIGVVYGDIGTSPLYTMREAFGGDDALPVTEASVFGVLSLIFWSLFVVVTLKYVIVILRADNRGEGGFWRSPRWRCATYRRADAAPCWCWPCSVRRCSTAMG